MDLKAVNQKLCFSHALGYSPTLGTVRGTRLYWDSLG